MDKAPVRGRAAARRAISAFAGLIACAGLGGCVEDGPSLSASAPATLARSNMIARVGVSPRGAPLAFTTIEGAPESVLARFRKATAAASRDIATTSLSRAGLYNRLCRRRRHGHRRRLGPLRQTPKAGAEARGLRGRQKRRRGSVGGRERPVDGRVGGALQREYRGDAQQHARSHHRIGPQPRRRHGPIN
jgi:hypothetical protein